MTTILPEINFINTDPQSIVDDVIATYESIEGRGLAQSDPLRMIFLTMASIIAKQNVVINDAAKQNLLYYSRDSVLDHKGYAWTTERLGSNAATAMIRFHMLQEMVGAKIIEKGTLLTDMSASLVFKTLEDATCEIGSNFVDVKAECTELGEVGNGLQPGEIDRMISPIYFVSSVENITESGGGTAPEKDDEYRERIRQAPEGISTAGPDGAYEFYAKKASSSIADVHVSTPTPGEVSIKVLLKGGELPGQEVLDSVANKLSAKDIRPLTDKVSVGAPSLVNYNLDIKYYIGASSIDKSLVNKSVESAIDDWIIWQSSKIGRDLNPSKLTCDCIRAGAKRVEIISPEFSVVGEYSVAQVASKSIIFGGVEDD